MVPLQLPTDCGDSRLQAPARLHTTAHNSDTTLFPRLHHSTTPRDRPRETETDRLLSLDRFHLLLLTLHSARAFISNALAPPFAARGGRRIRCRGPQGEMAQGHLSPKIRPPLYINFDPWLEPPLPRPEAQESKEGRRGNPRRVIGASSFLMSIHGVDVIRCGEVCGVVVVMEKVIGGWRGGEGGEAMLWVKW